MGKLTSPSLVMSMYYVQTITAKYLTGVEINAKMPTWKEKDILVISVYNTKIYPLIGFALHYARGTYRFALAAATVLRVGVLTNE